MGITLAVWSASDPAAVRRADERFFGDEAIAATTVVGGRVGVREVRRQRHVAVSNVSRIAAPHL